MLYFIFRTIIYIIYIYIYYLFYYNQLQVFKYPRVIVEALPLVETITPAAHTRAHTHTHTHTSAHTRTHTRTHMHTSAHTHAHLHTRTRTRAHTPRDTNLFEDEQLRDGEHQSHEPRQRDHLTSATSRRSEAQRFTYRRVSGG